MNSPAFTKLELVVVLFVILVLVFAIVVAVNGAPVS